MAKKLKVTNIDNVIRGDTRVVNLTFLQSDGVTPVNLAGGTVYFTVNTSSNPDSDASKVIQKTATSFTSALTGQHTFTLSHSDTNITPGTYYYDAEFVDSVGSYLSSNKGTFTVISDITRT